MASLPVINLFNGSSLHCNALPEVYPCVNDEFACWNSSSNCFGFFIDVVNNSIADLIPNRYCNYTICPVGTWGQSQLKYIPNLPGNALYLAIFALLLLLQIGLSIRWRTWGFLVGMVFGIGLEVVGYLGRIMMHNNIFDWNAFLIYLVPLTIAPAFMSASIYLCLSRIINLYSPSPAHISRFAPKTYTIVFMSCDLFSLILQAAGGGIAATTNSYSELQDGTHIMVAGLSFQVFSLLLFMLLCLDFLFALRRTPPSNPSPVTTTRRFKFFLHALALATICIFIRSVFRVAELSDGFGGALANQQVTYMVLEGAMIVLACSALTAWHPGPCFGGEWKKADFWKSKKAVVTEAEESGVEGKGSVRVGESAEE